MAARHGAITGAVVAFGLLGGGLLLADDVAAPAVASTASAERAPAAGPATEPASVPVAWSVPAASGGASRTASRWWTPARPAATRSASRVRAPQVVRYDDPPSVAVLPPRSTGVDRGIGDTGVHSDGTQYGLPSRSRYQPASQLSLTAVAVGGGIEVAWNHNGDPAARSYRVGYQPATWVRSTTVPGTLTRPDITWVTVPPEARAGRQTWRLARPATGTAYTVWLEVDVSVPVPDPVASPGARPGTTRLLLSPEAGVVVP